MEHTLKDYKKHPAYKQFISAVGISKDDFNKLSESEQLSKLEKWFADNNKKFRAKREQKETVTNTDTNTIESLLILAIDKYAKVDAQKYANLSLQIISLKNEKDDLDRAKELMDKATEDYNNKLNAYNVNFQKIKEQIK